MPSASSPGLSGRGMSRWLNHDRTINNDRSHKVLEKILMRTRIKIQSETEVLNMTVENIYRELGCSDQVYASESGSCVLKRTL